MSRFHVLTLTPTIASGANYDFDQDLGVNQIDIAKIKVTPSSNNSGYFLELYGDVARTDDNLQYSTIRPVAGPFFRPKRSDGTEGRQAFLLNYEDQDELKQLHGRLHNSDSVPRTYTVEIWYEAKGKRTVWSPTQLYVSDNEGIAFTTEVHELGDSDYSIIENGDGRLVALDVCLGPFQLDSAGSTLFLTLPSELSAYFANFARRQVCLGQVYGAGGSGVYEDSESELVTVTIWDGQTGPGTFGLLSLPDGTTILVFRRLNQTLWPIDTNMVIRASLLIPIL